MGEGSNIEWTHHTFNPWWGCTRVSPGCERCYAETWARRFGVGWGVKAERRLFGDKHWREPYKWAAAAERAGERHRVFCASMADVFEDRPELRAPRSRLFELIEDTPALDWLVLTKRPENVLGLAPKMRHVTGLMEHMWIGTTVEDQRRAEERIPHLLRIPARVRFLSCEPLLGPVDLRRWVFDREAAMSRMRNGPAAMSREQADDYIAEAVDWVIVGGESGPGARPMHPDWALSILGQCAAAGTPAFVKQLGSYGRSGKGGDLADMPKDLRVRDFPRAVEPPCSP